jgi:hypothetical protein
MTYDEPEPEKKSWLPTAATTALFRRDVPGPRRPGLHDWASAENARVNSGRFPGWKVILVGMRWGLPAEQVRRI